MRRSSVRATSLAIAATCGALFGSATLAGCSAENTPAHRMHSSGAAATIQVPAGDPETRAVGEAYRFGLARAEIDSRVEEVTDPQRRARGPLEWLADGGADLVVGCTGEILAQEDPATAQRLRDEFAGDADDEEAAGAAGDAAQRTYDAVMGVLRGDYDLPDPSPAQWCPRQDEEDAPGRQAATEAADELPANVVAVYRKNTVSRWGKRDLNAVTRLLSPHDIEEMGEKIAAGGDPEQIVRDWIAETNPGLLHV